ncbi:MAG: putative Fe-S cluster assembly protein SufT, partial [Verrucomicrobiota bacterium]|nr:putative Fe-S cluster assembly protein SufT [Verrucomicrobiota bacterium]
MTTAEPIELSRDVEASIVPSGDKVTLQKGEAAQVTQTLGGTFTVIVNGNMFRIEGSDADALGLEP